MRSLPIIAAFFAGFLTSTTSALGINCRGSMRCIPQDNDTMMRLSFYLRDMEGDYLDRIYHEGELIACYGHVCAFLQRVPHGLPGREIVKLANYVFDHGCAKCGSVPIDYPYSNNCDDGMLTFNFIYGCNDCVYYDWRGLCPPNTGGRQGGRWTWKCQNYHEPWKWKDGKPPPPPVIDPPLPNVDDVPPDYVAPEDRIPSGRRRSNWKRKEVEFPEDGILGGVFNHENNNNSSSNSNTNKRLRFHREPGFS